MKAMIREMVEAIKRLFTPKQQMQKLIANCEVSKIVEQKVTKKPKIVEKTHEKADESKKWSQTLMLQIKEYLNNNFVFRYNTLTGATEYKEKNGKSGYRPIDEREMNGIIVDARLEGIPCWRGDVPTMVLSNKVESYNPFHLYVKELPEWDGIDRVLPLLLRVSDNEIWLKGGHCWLRAMLSQWSGEERLHANALTPVLISGKQGLSKSTFCRLLMPDSLRHYFIDNLNLAVGSSPEKKLVKNGLINLDEFDKVKESQQATLKNLLQMVNIPVFRGKRLGWVNEPRLASFIATTNSYQVLIDPTGSRRFLCVEVVKPISEKPVEHKQLYAQLKEELKSGAPDYLSREEEKVLQKYNKTYYRQSLLEDVFHCCFRHPLEMEKGIWLTTAEIFQVMRKFNSAALKDVSARQLSLKLSAMGFMAKHTSFGNRYYVFNLLAAKK
ncbi:DUF3874 domain-containing protein [Bacteroides zhangwenhongii]|jgi:putative helicase|uniref:DUF3874 domain-containing protein n=2 Tax=Bacteroides TaxID=816 RepID=A0ABT5H3J9_9BACE|nr:DUF3874 domain-containing protein [Bacteroides zhangwenhongii]MDC7135176.1 DUF3874 domain-containing protein [Bacteroides zhangwenhongii]